MRGTGNESVDISPKIVEEVDFLVVFTICLVSGVTINSDYRGARAFRFPLCFVMLYVGEA